jgi:DNA-binding NarL/FixJ family response regulator
MGGTTLSDQASSRQKRPTIDRPRVLLADDHGSVLEQVISLLEPDFDVVGAVDNGKTLVIEAQRLKPDVIVLDIGMPIVNGIQAAHLLQGSGSTAKLIFLTVHQEPAFLRACFAEGALGYVTKPELVGDLIPAINEVLSGHRFVSPSLSRKSTKLDD